MWGIRSRFLLSIRSVRYTWNESKVDCVEASETIGVYKMIELEMKHLNYMGL